MAHAQKLIKTPAMKIQKALQSSHCSRDLQFKPVRGPPIPAPTLLLYRQGRRHYTNHICGVETEADWCLWGQPFALYLNNRDNNSSHCLHPPTCRMVYACLLLKPFQLVACCLQ